MFVGAGTLLNTATVLAGGAAGTLAGHRIPLRMRELVVQLLGIFVVVYGVKVAITPSFHEAPHLAIVLIGLLLGTVAGSLLDIDGALQRFGAWAERRLVRNPDPDQGTGRVARAFVTTTLLYCVGPLTILGTFDDGARGDILLLGIKSTLDGIASLAFAVTLGRGVLLSAGSVLVVQGGLTGVAYATRGAFDEFLVTQALGAGGLMLVAIGLGLLEIRRIRVADMLPGLVLAPVVAAMSRAFGWGL